MPARVRFDEVEVTSFVYDTSAHVTGEPGEEVTVNLGTGVWEVLGGGSDDDLDTQTKLSSSSTVKRRGRDSKTSSASCRRMRPRP